MITFCFRAVRSVEKCDSTAALPELCPYGSSRPFVKSAVRKGGLVCMWMRLRLYIGVTHINKTLPHILSLLLIANYCGNLNL